MSRKLWGVALPVGLAGTAWGLAWFISPKSPVSRGILAGILLALAESFLSTGALIWAWKKTTLFYWVWAGGMLFRLLVFAATAFVVYRWTSLSLTATLVTLVGATTLFLVVEFSAFFSKKR